MIRSLGWGNYDQEEDDEMNWEDYSRDEVQQNEKSDLFFLEMITNVIE